MKPFEFNFGDEVVSLPVGSRESFKGVITFMQESSKGPYYHVRDAFGFYWHRTAADLGRLQKDFL